VLALPPTVNDEGAGDMYIVEGIGYDFVPDVLTRESGDIDYWVKTGDEEAFDAVQQLMRKEGLLVGGSSGSSLGGTLKWFKTEAGKKVAQTQGKNVVIVLPDG
jgi:cystathionine beta-synthase